MKRALLFCAFVLLFFSQSFSQFILKAEYRPRFEYRSGYGQLLTMDQDPVLTVSQRTRISSSYQTGILSFGLGIQDVRVWGDEDWYSTNSVVGDSASLDLNEAWIGIKPYENGFIKIGRQYWIYEDERMLSQRNWNQSEVKYDGILYQNKLGKTQIDLGLSWNNKVDKAFTEPYPNNKMKSLNFIYIKRTINDWLYVSATALASGFLDNDSTNAINWMGTYGAYMSIKKGGLSALANGYYQSGTSRFSGKTTSAYMFTVNGDYLIKKKFSIGAGIDYLSGHDQENSETGYQEKSHAYDVLYGISHRYLGHMDLFSNLPKSTKNAGLSDIFIRAKWYFKETSHLGADFHLFSLQTNVAYTVEDEIFYYDKNLGKELDFYCSWDINKIFNIKGGYSFFMASETMEKFQGVYGNARFPNWAWIMLTAKPVFLDTTPK